MGYIFFDFSLHFVYKASNNMVNPRERGYIFPAQDILGESPLEHAKRIEMKIKDTLDVWEKDGREMPEGLVEQVRTFFVNDQRERYPLSDLFKGLGKTKALMRRVSRMAEDEGIRRTQKTVSLLIPLELAVSLRFEIGEAQPNNGSSKLIEPAKEKKPTGQKKQWPISSLNKHVFSEPSIADRAIPEEKVPPEEIAGVDPKLIMKNVHVMELGAILKMPANRNDLTNATQRHGGNLSDLDFIEIQKQYRAVLPGGIHKPDFNAVVFLTDYIIPAFDRGNRTAIIEAQKIGAGKFFLQTLAVIPKGELLALFKELRVRFIDPPSR